MKTIKRLTALVLVVLMFTSLFAVGAEAASIPTIKSGTTYKLKNHYTGSKENAVVYKLKLTKDSLVTFSWSGNKKAKDGSDNLSIGIYSDKECGSQITSVITFEYTNTGTKFLAKGTQYLALSKGTYYIKMYDGETKAAEPAAAKVKITVTPAVNKANYCRAKAIALKAGTKVNVIQTSSNVYDRWYKFTLTQEKTVRIYTPLGREGSIEMYTARSSVSVPLTAIDTYLQTTDPLPAGTYYIRVNGDYDIPWERGSFIQFYWK